MIDQGGLGQATLLQQASYCFYTSLQNYVFYLLNGP